MRLALTVVTRRRRRGDVRFEPITPGGGRIAVIANPSDIRGPSIEPGNGDEHAGRLKRNTAPPKMRSKPLAAGKYARLMPCIRARLQPCRKKPLIVRALAPAAVRGFSTLPSCPDRRIDASFRQPRIWLRSYKSARATVVSPFNPVAASRSLSNSASSGPAGISMAQAAISSSLAP